MKVKGASKLSSTPHTLGGRIRAVRKAWGWTQEDLAKALGNDRQIISYWERDQAKPTRSAMQLLAQVFGLKVEALSDGEGFTIHAPLDSSGTTNPLEAIRLALRDLHKEIAPGSIQVVNLTGGLMEALTLRETKALLDQAHKKGLTVLLVTSPGN